MKRSWLALSVSTALGPMQFARRLQSGRTPGSEPVALPTENIDDAGTTGGAYTNGEDEGVSAPGPDPAQLRDLATKQHNDRMLTLLTQSAVALGVMAVISIVFGWVMASRALRPRASSRSSRSARARD